jgi:hypothetical protein
VPDHLPCFLLNDDDGGYRAERGEDVAIFEWKDGVDERPVFASVMRVQREGLGIEVLDSPP